MHHGDSTLRARLNHEILHQKKQGWWWILAILNHYIKFSLYHCIAIKIPSKPVVYVWQSVQSFLSHYFPTKLPFKPLKTSGKLMKTPSNISWACAPVPYPFRQFLGHGIHQSFMTPGRFRRAWGWCQKEIFPIQSFGRFRYFYIFLCMGKIWWSLMILWTSIYHQILSKVPPVSAHDGMFTHIILRGVFRRGSWSLAFCCLNLSFLRDGVIIVNHPPNIAAFWVFLALDLPHYLCSNSRWGVVSDIRVTCFFARRARLFTTRPVSTVRFNDPTLSRITHRH